MVFVKIYFDNFFLRCYNLGMNKTVLIVWLVIAAICLGLGIMYGVMQNFTAMVGFIAVAAGTAVVGIVRYRRMKNEQNKKDDEE